MSMFTHTYPRKPPRKIKVIMRNHQADNQLNMCGLMSELVICKFRKSMVIHDTECPYCDKVSLNNTNQTTAAWKQIQVPIVVSLCLFLTPNSIVLGGVGGTIVAKSPSMLNLNRP